MESATLEVLNPATGEVIDTLPTCTGEQLDAVMGAAGAAQPAWQRSAGHRRALLREIADVLRSASAELAAMLTAEQGKPIREAEREIGSAVRWFEYFAEQRVEDEVVQDDDVAKVEVTRRPVGPVAAFVPWNYPISLAAWKIAPALLAGNTMVLKPSPYTPLTTVRVGELLRGVLPAGVFEVVVGTAELGVSMVAHPVPRKISFTGSVAVGKLVAAAAAADLKRVTLELGGNDAAVVLDDIDVEEVAEKLFWAAFTNCGQVCTAVKRVYAPRSLHGPLVDALAAHARAVVVGDGALPATRIGPVNNEAQRSRVAELVRESVAAGARCVAGGRPIPGPGTFHEPTILADADDGMPIVDEEQFGPALPVVPYDDVDDAVRRANGTRFALGASVWSADEARAAAVAPLLVTGTTWVNTHRVVGPHQPFGGLSCSGLGTENGRSGLHAFTDIHVSYTPKN